VCARLQRWYAARYYSVYPLEIDKTIEIDEQENGMMSLPKMPLTEFEFTLPAVQYQLMNYPKLTQGESLTVELETDLLLPEPGGESWFAVQSEAVAPRFSHVAPATYAIAGKILEAEIIREEEQESAILLVDCGEFPLRVSCGPAEDGRLPYGTWETRYLVGLSRIYGIVESDFATSIGEPIGVTIWGFRRLVLAPGDPVFGQWHESDVLPATPFTFDHVVVSAHLHRNRLQ